MLTLVALFHSVETVAQLADLRAKILMPGPLIDGHADLANKCESCHSSFDRFAQDGLCLECHDQVATDLQEGRGYHGRSDPVAGTSCRECHRDHRGAEFDPVPMDREMFDHTLTDFPLTGAHQDAACDTCHSPDQLFREAPGECNACHAEQEPHEGRLGEDCGSCHSASGWLAELEFDHSLTDFPLRGSHAEAVCAACHAGQQHDLTATTCVDCHGLIDVHRGQFGGQCDSCHTEEAWDTTEFDHSAKTDFALRGAHSQQSCQACHHQSTSGDKLSGECVACHRQSDIHSGRHGEDCGSCHGSSDWSITQFDHGASANWPLEGVHGELSCLSCHRGSLEETLDKSCLGCHVSDDVHRDPQTENCDACHQPESWSETRGFDHELTRFPLEGMHAVATCRSCHRNHRYRKADSACNACHVRENPHGEAFGIACEDCHTPNGWQLWVFDHGMQTEFSLVGAHEDLACDDCHRGNERETKSSQCTACHAADDRHQGEFGPQCGRCHGSESFGDVKWPD